ncbi:hypothetical protein GCM10007094_01580 [Pseudovibrio japonicus]|uniref:Beta-lactamase-related domain-containing protein n=1 Tax=Pseudovibrio japonicus TaxID=366534 RepID=A0ABQ3DVI9_9HYPH|nr:serine hydrolase domain-containing protein [Pseudovibrio japonicus]GHB17686.1 hypothetical protein GCM10007094_01580 [Pseudovibrio japonicus]
MPDWVLSVDELTTMLKRFDVPGMAVVGIKNCAPTKPMNIGLATLNPPEPIVDNSVFEAASLSKPVFAYLVMQLVEEGVIDLDRPIADELDYARITDKQRYGQITPKMVLSHQTGLPNWAGNAGDPDRDTPIAFTNDPGTHYAYSGEAFELLRHYVESKTGKPLNQIFREHLGALMPQSTYVSPLPTGISLTRGYKSAQNTQESRGFTNLRERANAAASLVTTPRDYSRFLGWVCERKGLSEESYSAIFSPITPVPAQASSEKDPIYYGLGWGVTTQGSEVVIFHDGNNDEYRSIFALFPESDEGIVVFTNGSNGGALIDTMIEQMQ